MSNVTEYTQTDIFKNLLYYTGPGDWKELGTNTEASTAAPTLVSHGFALPESPVSFLGFILRITAGTSIVPVLYGYYPDPGLGSLDITGWYIIKTFSAIDANSMQFIKWNDTTTPFTSQISRVYLRATTNVGGCTYFAKLYAGLRV